MARPARGGAFWVAVGGTSILAMTLLNIAADRLPLPGLAEFRDYLTRPNG